ncbi:MAG: HPr family phosphocarrier protein [Phycisphaerales bacterium]|nr:HPr family phosphocarrier protein [Phycisphaerales bacterium]
MTTNASAIVTIENRLGLHARPAMMFAETAMRFDSDITVQRSNQDSIVDGKSIMQLMMLAAVRGTELTLTANGPDAETALEELAELVNNRFNEDSVEGV